jgi:hypothetical protein
LRQNGLQLHNLTLAACDRIERVEQQAEVVSQRHGVFQR